MTEWSFRMAVCQGFAWAPGEMPVSPETWTDTVPILSFSFKRGKNEDLDEFDAGSATIVVPNLDDSLDTLAGGSFWGQSEMWLPVSIVADNGTLALPLWTGFITSASPLGINRFPGSVTITATDWIGWASQWDCPSGWAGSVARRLAPVLWWRGRTDLVRREAGTTGGTLFDEVGVRDGDIGGTAAVWEVDGLIPGDDAKALRVYGDATHYAPISAPSSPELPSVSEWTVCLWFKSPDTTAYSIVRSTIGGTLAWDIGVDSSGQVFANVRNGAATIIATATVTGMDASDNQAYFVEAHFKTTATRKIEIFVTDDAGSTIGGSTSGFGSGAVGGGGRITYGPNGFDSVIRLGDLVVSEANLPYTLASVVTYPDEWTIFTGTENTIEEIVAAIGVAVGAEIPMTATWELAETLAATDDGLNKGSQPVRSNLADVVAGIASAGAGAAWCQRDGRVRIRDFAALDALLTFPTEYGLDIAFITDDETVDPSVELVEVIHPEGRGRSGLRHDRITNDVLYTFGYSDDYSTSYQAGVRVMDSASIGLYGRRSVEFDIKSAHPNIASDVAAVLEDAGQDILARRDAPNVEIADVVLSPMAIVGRYPGDPGDTLVRWCIESLDLEKLVTYQEHTPLGTLVYDQQCRVIRESWDWNGGVDLKVTIGLAPVGAYVAP